MERREKFLLALIGELKDKITLSELLDSALPEIIGFVRAQKGAVFFTSGKQLVLSSSSGFPKESVEGLKNLQIEDDAVSWCAKNGSPQMVKSFSDSEKRLVNLIADDQIKSVICAPLLSKGKNLGVLAVFSKKEFKKEDLLALSSLGKEIGEMVQCLNYQTEIKVKSQKLDSVETQRKLLTDLFGMVAEPKTERILNRVVWIGAQMIHSDSCKIFEVDSQHKMARVTTSSVPNERGKKVDISESAEMKEVLEKREIVFKTFEATEKGINSFLALPLLLQDEIRGALVFEFKEYSSASTEVEIDLAKSLANFTSFVLFQQRLSQEGEKELAPFLDFLHQLNGDLTQISESPQLFLKEIQNSKIDPHIISQELRNIEEMASKLNQAIREIPGYPEVEDEVPKEEKKEAKPKILKILAIDDQKIIRDLLNDMVESLGYQIELAEGGQQGLKIFEENNFDMVIAESVMPEISGWDVSREVKRLRPDVSVILLTELVIPPEKKMLEDHGVDFVLSKPFRLDQLNGIIQRAKEMKK
jgi:two-component system response regulator